MIHKPGGRWKMAKFAADDFTSSNSQEQFEFVNRASLIDEFQQALAFQVGCSIHSN